MKSMQSSRRSRSKQSRQHQRTTPFFPGNSHTESSFIPGKASIESPFFEKAIQAKAKNDATLKPGANINTKNQTKNETGIPTGLKYGLESLSGENLSGVRVHRNSSEPEAIQAHAFTKGQDIYLAPGQEKHLPHEGWHVVQQMQGRVKPTIQQKSALINDDTSLEQEANVMGERAAQMKPNDASAKAKNTGSPTNTGVIQRAMKFEYQLKKNFLYRDTGSEVHRLPRKYGPRDYIIRLPSGARLESETNGQIEYETSWEKKWSKLSEQINEIQFMSQIMQSSPSVKGSNNKTYKRFPFSAALKHLTPDKGFSTSSGKWNKNQKEGKAKVHKPNEKKENFRSTTSYASSDNILHTIDHGEKVFVKYFSADAKWARIKDDGKLGWIWSRSLEMDSKRYESNKDSRGVYSDTPLQPQEKLLVEVGDTDWKPYVQISESFNLEQFETYLMQYEKKWAASLTGGTRQYLLENNPEKAPSGESLADKMIRESDFLSEHNKLKNLLLMVGYYIEKGRTQTTLHKKKQPDGTYKEVPGPAKWAFSLMSRTNFGSIYGSLSKKEQKLFTQMVYNTKSGIIPTMKLTNSSKMFMDGTGTGYNPTVRSWLISITKGKDILSAQTNSVSGAMGKFNLDKEKRKQKDLVRFEARREADNFPKLWQWDDHALRHFVVASILRSRAKGKGETGLEF